MRFPFQMKLASVAFAVALAVFVSAFWLAHHNIEELTSASQWRQHTYQVLAELRALRADLVDAETGARGFVIAGDEAFLAPFGAARASVPARLSGLARMIADNPVQRQRLAAAEPLVRRRLALLDDLVRERREQGGQAASVRSLVTSGRQAMDELRGLLGEMEREEERLLALRDGSVERRTRRVDWTLLASCISGVGLLLGVFLALDREVRRRRAVEVELRGSQEQLRAFFEMSQDLAVIAGFDGRFKRVNPSWQRVFGHTPEALTSSPFADFLHPDDRERTAAEYEDQIRQGKVVLFFENRYRCKDGSYRWLQWTSKPDAQSGLIYAIARDITEQKQVHDEVARAREAAESANKELEAFSYSVSHDLRTPLRVIDGFSHALLEEYAARLDTKGKDYLQRMRKNAQRMAQLIEDLLKLSRIGRAEMNLERLDVSALVRSVADEVRGREPERAVTFRAQDGLRDEADPRLLRVVFENLIANSWKFTRKTPEALIEFGAERGNGPPPVYFLRDNGAGFDMAFAEKLFGAFQRLHPASDFEGTGIGLATVARVIRRHGGRIWAQAAPQRGATFYFTLAEPRGSAGETRVA